MWEKSNEPTLYPADKNDGKRWGLRGYLKDQTLKNAKDPIVWNGCSIMSYERWGVDRSLNGILLNNRKKKTKSFGIP